jgi:hypothetical protein
MIINSVDTDRVAKIVAAFYAMPLTETEDRIFDIMLTVPAEGFLASEVSLQMGWQDDAAGWNSNVGKMGRRFEPLLGPAPTSASGEPFYSGIFVDCEHDGANWRFWLKPEVVAALVAVRAGQLMQRIVTDAVTTVLKHATARKPRRGIGSY